VAAEPGGHGRGIDDGARVEHGACEVYCARSGGADGVRGDGLGVGDVGEVPGGIRGEGYSTGGDDGRGWRGQRDAGVVTGRGRGERDAAAEQGGDGVGVDDGAWVELGACEVHREGTGGAHGVRGDRLGVGDVGEVSGGARGWIDKAGGDDGRGEGRERDAGVVGGWGRAERDAWGEPGGI